ncbi:MAG TPA: hypothetical protein VIZ31_06030 [Vicinamibacteria bacterium]
MTPKRVVALGASNLTRGLPTLLALARSAFGPEVELFACLGLGRSYGAGSRVGFRSLPGILESGLWAALETRDRVETRALVTDVGNDILYGHPVPRILEWVEECVTRLQSFTRDIVVTDLPVASLERVGEAEFLFFRSVLYPPCRLDRAEVLASARQVSEGLFAMARRRGLRTVCLVRDWYGVDPIHVRLGAWDTAWKEILHGNGALPGSGGSSWSEKLRLYALRPERERFFGLERLRRQTGARLSGGGRVWLY